MNIKYLRIKALSITNILTFLSLLGLILIITSCAKEDSYDFVKSLFNEFPEIGDGRLVD